mgnify:CR=1 FL=1
MEQNVIPPQPMPSSEQVSFPHPAGAEKKSNGVIKWIIVIIGVIAIVAGGIFFIMRTSGSEGTANATPTPTINAGGITPVATPEPTTTPSPTPSAEPVDRSGIKVQVLNGTGTAGDAGLVKTALEKLEFSDITAANADEQEETTTTVTYSSDIDAATIDEIVASLEKIFSEVEAKKGTIAGDFDIRILTGEKK